MPEPATGNKEDLTQHMPREPHEGMKADTDPETAALEHDQSSYVARGGRSSGAVDSGPRPGDEQPSQTVGGGTASVGPLVGVTADADDVRNAVGGDTGPTRPRRR